MGFFDKLFGKKENKTDKGNTSAAGKAAAAGKTEADAAGKILASQQQSFAALAAGKSPAEKVSEQMLLQIFAEYFAPNKDFYSVPGSDKFNAYFNAVNTARDEMFRQQQLFAEATKWSSQDLAELVNNPKPGITNMMICSLIFLMGNYAVIKDAVYCVDFSERIPNCVALYLLLIAQKQPADKRTQIIDAGDGTDKKPLTDALEGLHVCDPSWNYKVW